ncbi:hypothetical protein PI124_g19527 [Phytophthora idaei]|nr:hypothetical protein PI124_g19527 [Phytophthora idaei]
MTRGSANSAPLGYMATARRFNEDFELDGVTKTSQAHEASAFTRRSSHGQSAFDARGLVFTVVLSKKLHKGLQEAVKAYEAGFSVEGSCGLCDFKARTVLTFSVNRLSFIFCRRSSNGLRRQ